MSSHAHTALTTLGFSFGFVGIVGLVISLIALIPLNAYNIALSIRTAAELSNTYGDGSILIPGPYRPQRAGEMQVQDNGTEKVVEKE
ncbi:unnamed protein product [Umbelopsis vinacea]